MKNVIKTVCSLVAVLAFSATLSAQPSAEKIADGFAKARAVYWQVNGGYTGNSKNGTSSWYDINFTLQPRGGRWAITQYRLNNVELPIDAKHPLWQIPGFDGQVTGFYLSANGINSAGQQVRNGYFNRQGVLGADESIKIDIYLNYVSGSVPYVLGGGHTAQNTIIQSDDGNNTGYYDSGRQAFMISYDPLNPPRSFNVIDVRDNSVIRSIPFEDLGSNTSTPSSGHGFSMDIEGGTLETTITSDVWTVPFRGLSMDQEIERSGVKLSGKIILANMEKLGDYIQVYAYGVRSGSKVEVFGLQSDGQMVSVASQTAVNDLGWTLVITNLTGYVTYKIVADGAPLSPIRGLSVDIYRSSYPWVFSTPVEVGNAAVSVTEQ